MLYIRFFIQILMPSVILSQNFSRILVHHLIEILIETSWGIHSLVMAWGVSIIYKHSRLILSIINFSSSIRNIWLCNSSSSNVYRNKLRGSLLHVISGIITRVVRSSIMISIWLIPMGILQNFITLKRFNNRLNNWFHRRQYYRIICSLRLITLLQQQLDMIRKCRTIRVLIREWIDSRIW